MLATTGIGLNDFRFWLISVSIFVLLSIGGVLAVLYLLTPLKNISAALTHISGEPTNIKPPNPNSGSFEKIGLKPLLQLIYSSPTEKEVSSEEESRQSLPAIERGLNQTSVGIIILDRLGNILFANNSAPIAIDSDEKKSLELLFDNNDGLDKWLDEVSDQVRAERAWLRVPSHIVGEENRRIFDVIATFEKGSEAEIVLVLVDRTKDYQPEDESLDFIAFAAHELRGPITVIRGYLDVLGMELGHTLAADQQELMKRLTVSANRLSSYINNILNTSKYDRRHLKLHLSEDKISDIYTTINDDMALRAQSQNRILSVNIPEDLPTIAADRSSISEVIGNLIDNALKYSHEGGIVNVSAKTDGDFVRVSVQDYGIGIPASVVGNLFHKFYRSHRSRETVAGTGIGLYICKALVESHGGEIGVTSTEGQGSVFSFTVPIYSTVADKLISDDSSNEGLISDGSGWIKNHSMYKG